MKGWSRGWDRSTQWPPWGRLDMGASACPSTGRSCSWCRQEVRGLAKSAGMRLGPYLDTSHCPGALALVAGKARALPARFPLALAPPAPTSSRTWDTGSPDEEVGPWLPDPEADSVQQDRLGLGRQPGEVYKNPELQDRSRRGMPSPEAGSGTPGAPGTLM